LPQNKLKSVKKILISYSAVQFLTFFHVHNSPEKTSIESEKSLHTGKDPFYQK